MSINSGDNLFPHCSKQCERFPNGQLVHGEIHAILVVMCTTCADTNERGDDDRYSGGGVDESSGGIQRLRCYGWRFCRWWRAQKPVDFFDKPWRDAIPI
jgi:hypothetical protein